eukprot:3542480-Amphidinium_carterae.1
MKSDGRLEVVELEAEEVPIHLIPQKAEVMMTVVMDEQQAGIETVDMINVGMIPIVTRLRRRKRLTSTCVMFRS